MTVLPSTEACMYVSSLVHPHFDKLISLSFLVNAVIHQSSWSSTFYNVFIPLIHSVLWNLDIEVVDVSTGSGPHMISCSWQFEQLSFSVMVSITEKHL